jgi:hypothetical protein
MGPGTENPNKVEALTEVASKVTLVLPFPQHVGGTGHRRPDSNPLPASTRWAERVLLCSAAEVRVPARFLNKTLSSVLDPPPPRYQP